MILIYPLYVCSWTVSKSVVCIPVHDIWKSNKLKLKFPLTPFLTKVLKIIEKYEILLQFNFVERVSYIPNEKLVIGGYGDLQKNMPSKLCWSSGSFNCDRAKRSETYAKKSLGLVQLYFTHTSHNPENSVLGTKQHTYSKCPPICEPGEFVHSWL